jgi:cyclopropane fatty-acyl-phospholipid synthase-like methyltransferase
MTPASHRHTASVCRGEAEARRSTHPEFAVTLAQWADNADRRADEIQAREQPDFFRSVM